MGDWGDEVGEEWCIVGYKVYYGNAIRAQE